ncbi:MAG: MFS transporter [Rhizomicrobium sp.]
MTAAAPSMSAESIVRLQWLLGTACAALIANLYYAQPLTGLIGGAIGIPPQSVGLLVTLPLAGYGAGMLMLVPLADLFENRRLVLALVAGEAVCVLLLALLSRPELFLGAAFATGVLASAVQVLVPYVTYVTPEAMRGQAVGKVVSGVMLGIMLARPLSSFVSDMWSWRAIFWISAGLLTVLFAALWLALPNRQPAADVRYGNLLISMGRIFATTPILRRRAFYHALMFGAFSVFWTAVPLWLTGPQFNLSQRGVALVALAGVAGAVAPPLAGRMADNGFTRSGTIAAMLLAAGAVLATLLVRGGSLADVVVVALCAIVLDFAVSANLVFGQRAIYALAPDQRSRVNSLFMTTFFVGGAIASALSGWMYFRFGWPGIVALGGALPLFGLLYLSTERQ